MIRLIPPAPNPPIPVDQGETVLQALVRAGFKMRAPCGGAGVCGGCVVEILREGTPVTVKACATRITEDTHLTLPPGSLEEGIRGPGGTAGVAMRPDTVADLDVTIPRGEGYRSGSEGLLAALRGTPEPCAPPSLTALRALGALLQGEEGGTALCRLIHHGTAWTPIDLLPLGAASPLGVAIDLGTTTIALALIDLASGAPLGNALLLNPQVPFGDDVISRILAAGRLGIPPLRQPLLDLIGATVRSLLAAAGAPADRLVLAAAAGNPTMTHLALGVDPDAIRRPPYQPPVDRWPWIPLPELGIPGHPEGRAFIVPAVAGWIGGDIVAGMLVAGIHRRREVGCLVDLGTNGEIVLGNDQWLMSASCSAGPAFEGGGFRDGVRAVPGAVDEIIVGPDGGASWSTIGHRPPIGFCGSGLVDLVAGLRVAGLIDGRGRFVPERVRSRMTASPDGGALAVVPAEASGTGRALAIREDEIDNLLRAKAAIYAGIAHLAHLAGIAPTDIATFHVAGGMGSYLNIPRAQLLGLIPEVPEERIRYLGNASLAGSLLTLCTRGSREEAADIARRITAVDLGEGGGFHERFLEALFIPHTDPSSFPLSWGILERAAKQVAEGTG